MALKDGFSQCVHVPLVPLLRSLQFLEELCHFPGLFIWLTTEVPSKPEVAAPRCALPVPACHGGFASGHLSFN